MIYVIYLVVGVGGGDDDDDDDDGYYSNIIGKMYEHVVKGVLFFFWGNMLSNETNVHHYSATIQILGK